MFSFLTQQRKPSTKQNATYGMGENICKQCDQQEVNIQNVQIAHMTQYQKNKQLNQKMGRRSK